MTYLEGITSTCTWHLGPKDAIKSECGKGELCQEREGQE